MLDVSNQGQSIVLRIDAEIDFSTCDALEQTVNTAAAGNDASIVIDFTSCAYLDSSCLAVLVREHRELGSRMSVVVPQRSRTRRIFEVSGLLAVLPIVESVADATSGRLAIERNVE